MSAEGGTDDKQNEGEKSIYKLVVRNYNPKNYSIYKTRDKRQNFTYRQEAEVF